MTSATMNNRSVIVKNASYEELGRVTVQKAVRLLALGKAVVEEADETKGRLRDWAYPKVIRLVYFVKVNFDKIYGTALWSKNGVLRRDNHKCTYCGKAAKTIDHIHPQSRGGLNTWMNTIASCFDCNNKKDNKTPAEAGMRMRFQPHVPTKFELIRNK